MTEQEQNELLKEVARVAPAEMYLLLDEYEGECFIRFGYLTFDAGDVWEGTLDFSGGRRDIDNSYAIIAMLDAMEKDGWTACVGSRIDEDGVRIPGYPCDCYDTVNCEPLSTQGATRTEAVARAFVAVFGDKP